MCNRHGVLRCTICAVEGDVPPRLSRRKAPPKPKPKAERNTARPEHSACFKHGDPFCIDCTVLHGGAIRVRWSLFFRRLTAQLKEPIQP